AAALEHFRQTGEVSASVLAELAAVGGGYGAELEELFKRQLAVAAATGEVEDAERRLLEARKQEESTGKLLSKQAREYNRLLREGASEEELRAKLAEMKATHENLENARDAAELAEDDVETAKERAKEANKLARLQANLLQQLIDMARLREEAADGDGDGIPDIPEPPFGAIISGLDQAFEELKNRIRARFEELWADLKADWDASGIGVLLNDLKEKWEASKLKMWFEEFILDVKEEGIKTALSNLWLKIAPAVQSWLDDKDTWWADIWRAFTKEGIDDGSGRVSFGDALAALWDVIKEGLNTLVSRFGNWLGQLVTGQLEDTKAEGDSLGDAFVRGLLAGLLLGLAAKVMEWHNAIVDFFQGGVDAVKTFLGIRSASTVFENIGRAMKDGLVSGLSGLGDALKYAFNEAIWRAEQMANIILDGVNDVIRAVRSLPGAPWIWEVGHVNLPRLEAGGLVTA
ncbi:unnamed protein product, partial [marine sediment metagenome]